MEICEHFIMSKYFGTVLQDHVHCLSGFVTDAEDVEGEAILSCLGYQLVGQRVEPHVAAEFEGAHLLVLTAHRYYP